jgi:hypothetical protein
LALDHARALSFTLVDSAQCRFAKAQNPADDPQTRTHTLHDHCGALLWSEPRPRVLRELTEHLTHSRRLFANLILDRLRVLCATSMTLSLIAGNRQYNRYRTSVKSNA